MSATRRLRPPKGSNDVDAGFEEDRALRRIVRGPAVHSGGHLPAHRMVRPDSEAKGKASRASHQRRHVGSALLRTGGLLLLIFGLKTNLRLGIRDEECLQLPPPLTGSSPDIRRATAWVMAATL